MPLKPWQIKSEIRLPLIPLNHGKIAIVDHADYELLCQCHWHARRSHSKWYAVRKVRTGRTCRTIFIHRQIGRARPDQQVHHLNHNSLDNRRCNLIALDPREHDLLDRLDRLQLKNQATTGVTPQTHVNYI